MKFTKIRSKTITSRAKKSTTKTPASVDEYIAHTPTEVQTILKRIRKIVTKAAPGAVETISYGMPHLQLHGMLIFYGAFQEHIGFYPPIRGNDQLVKEVSKYANEKGNLKFPLGEPIPYDLIEKITKHRVAQNIAAFAEKQRKKAAAKRSGKSLNTTTPPATENVARKKGAATPVPKRAREK